MALTESYMLPLETKAPDFSLPNVIDGKFKSLNEIKEVLSTMSLFLGMEIPNWPPDNIAELSKKLEENL